MKVNPAIFREYDIRGIVDKDLDDNVMELIAKAFCAYAQQFDIKRIALGYDARVTSPRYAQVMANAVAEAGIEVINIGMCPSPVMYFALFTLPVQGGLMVTASHNPKEYNGVKVAVGKSTIYGEEIQKLYQIIHKGDFVTGKKKAAITKHAIIPEYQQYIINNISIARPMNIALDAGNGVGGVVALDIFKHFGATVEELYIKPDGTFPNHVADPTVPKYMEDLRKRVLDKKLEVGIAYDGDADRIGVIDDQGNLLWGDMLLLLFSRELLKKHPGAAIISEVKASQRLYDDIAKHGGKPIMWKTGHSLIKAKIKEEHALLAGEMSGHMFFADRYFGYDDAVYASCRVLELLSHTDKKLSDLLADVPKTAITPEIRVPSTDQVKFKVIEQLKKEFEGKYKIIDIDGLRIQFPDGSWALARPSNTQAVIVMRFEAPTEQRLAEIRSLVEGRFQELHKKLLG